MDNNKNFKPYIPAEKITSEITVTAIIMGVLLSVIFGAANAYIGLRVGMTVSASIPAAVIAMGVIRVIMRKNSILESNMVQTIGSAGESLAAGAIFTMPALYLWAEEGVIKKPSLLTITIIALVGGLLGVFFMIPLRNALIVKEHNTLPYPEGQACADVMLAGEEGGSSASTVFTGMGFAALFKFIIDGLKLIPGEVTLNLPKKVYPGAIGTQIYPAVMSVGYICGPRISSFMFAGGLLSWMVLIPAIVIFGSSIIMAPGEVTIGEIFASDGAAGIWDTYIRYIGAGALAAGGIISLMKSLPLIARTFKGAVKAMSVKGGHSSLRTDKDLNMIAVICVIIALTVIVWLTPAIPVSPLGAVMVVVFGFFFATVSSRMVGLVGSSNNPVSGMAIATLLMSCLILKSTGTAGTAGYIPAIAIGSIICIVAAIAGDTSQDLKTGYLLGATPWKQQVGEIIGVVSAALAIGFTLNILSTAWDFGSKELPSAQASLMKLVVEGVMGGELPWGLILIGVFIAIIVEILRLPVLAVAIGIYLPIQLNACIMVGGLIRLFMNKMKAGKRKDAIINKGVLFSSGMIAGEGLIGILLAIFAVAGIDGKINLSGLVSKLSTTASNISGLAFFGIIIAVFVLFCFIGKKNKDKE